MNSLAPDWPNRETSRFVATGGLTWHVQVTGTGPVLLLIHGTGAATISWRDMLPSLAEHFTIVAPDLPGHGLTRVPASHRLSLPGMARNLTDLLRKLNLAPQLAVGHSAGAAILARMCLDHMIAPAGLVSLNGAIMPLAGPAGQVFAPLARLLVGLPILPQLFAWRAASPGMVEKLLANTGSQLDPRGIALYTSLVRNPDHAAAALRMMANWDLPPLVRDLPALVPKLLLIAADRDRAIPPADANRIAALVPGSHVVHWPGLGHLAHEERPTLATNAILDFARTLGVL